MKRTPCLTLEFLHESGFGGGMQFLTGLVLLLAICTGTPSASQAAAHRVAPADLAVWLKFQTAQSKQRMLGNISRWDSAVGSVVASPSKTTPNYYFHWVRDAALTMDQVLTLWEKALSDGHLNEAHGYRDMIEDYLRFSKSNQQTANPSGAAYALGLGEPKFLADGSAFNENWGRPQNDGPALRALTFSRFALRLIDLGELPWVRKNLFDGKAISMSPIRVDLAFVKAHWNDASFDLWEEIKGDHFYTRKVQQASLIKGAELALALGETTLAQTYLTAAADIGNAMGVFWDEGAQFWAATRNRVDGASHKISNIDAAVILAWLHSDLDNSHAGDPSRLATFERMLSVFDSIYAINAHKHDGNGLTLGTSLGRYPEDRYNGLTTDSDGNPWFLITFAMAESFVRLSDAVRTAGTVTITDQSAAFWKRAVHGAFTVHAGDTFSAGDLRFSTLLSALDDRVYEFLRRARFHSDYSGNLTEQFDRTNGYMRGAADLTWSHAAFLSLVNRLQLTP